MDKQIKTDLKKNKLYNILVPLVEFRNFFASKYLPKNLHVRMYPCGGKYRRKGKEILYVPVFLQQDVP